MGNHVAAELEGRIWARFRAVAEQSEDWSAG